MSIMIQIIIGLLLFFKPEILLRLKYGRYTKDFPKSAIIIQRVLGVIFVVLGIVDLIYYIFISLRL